MCIKNPGVRDGDRLMLENEVKRLRALCARAAKQLKSTAGYPEFADDEELVESLEKAAEGRK